MAKAAKSEIAAPSIHNELGKGSRTVTVACKFPAGIILQLCREVKFVEEGLGGTRINRVRYDKAGPTHTVRGPATPNGQVPKGYVRAVVEGGYALTPGIPEDFWTEWLKQNEENPLVINKMIFAHADHGTIQSTARSREGLLSGFEPIVPDSDPRIPRSVQAGVGGVQTATVGDK